MIFRPDAEGLEEQRFLHIGETFGDRFMFETRLTDDGQRFVDNYLCSGKPNKTLLNQDFNHPVGEWFHTVAVFDGSEMTNYVNGEKEVSGLLRFSPMTSGQTSIGATNYTASFGFK